MTPKISVIIPVCEFNRHVCVAVDSIIKQTFQDFEIIVSINGSNASIVESKMRLRYGTKIRTVSTRLRQLSHALNIGISESSAPLIARMDSDDIAFPDRFARQVDFLESNPDVDVVGSRALAFRDHGGVVGLLPFAQSHAEICARPWNGVLLAHPTWMGRATWFKRHRYREPEFCRAEDQELLLRTFRYSTFACLPDVLLAYRQRPFSARRTLVGRTSLLQAQIRLFFQNGDIGSLTRSLLLYGVKSIIDLVASVPGLDELYFMRMNEAPDHQTLNQFSHLLEELGR